MGFNSGFKGLNEGPLHSTSAIVKVIEIRMFVWDGRVQRTNSIQIPQ